MILPLDVIDPALGEAEGHHAGFAAMLAASRPSGRQVRLWAHRKMTVEAAQSMEETGLGVERAFSSHYYRHFGKPGNPASLAGYIVKLASEYAEVYRKIVAVGQPRCLLYHTLSWEHTNALALALQLRDSPPFIQHRVLLMFNPGIDHSGRTTQPQLRLNYRVALARLQRLPGVRLYAGCGEHAVSYAQLLEMPDPLPLHPCLMGSWQQMAAPRPAMPSPDAIRLLLYLGDAKANKGFASLPGVISRLQSQCGPEARFVVQYNRLPSWAGESLRQVERQMQTLAATERRLELHCGFWSDAQLQQQLAQAHLLLLNYNPREYEEKTSGLLWLAAWHKLPALLPQGWLQREAERLGLPYAHCDVIDKLARLAGEIKICQADQDYSNRLFTPLWDWLDVS